MMNHLPSLPSSSVVMGSLFWALLGVGYAAPEASVAVDSIGDVDLTSLTWPGALVVFGMFLRTAATTFANALGNFTPTLVVEHRYADNKGDNDTDSHTSE